MPDIEKVKTLHWLTDPEWFRKAGLEKGVGHDRQHLGVILAAGGELTISQIDMDFMGELTLRLLNNDGRTERVFAFRRNAPHDHSAHRLGAIHRYAVPRWRHAAYSLVHLLADQQDAPGARSRRGGILIFRERGTNRRPNSR